MEVNASDTRNKADKSAKTGMGGKLSNTIKELVNNTALGVARDGHRKRVRPGLDMPFRSPAVCHALATSVHALLCGHFSASPHHACCFEFMPFSCLVHLSAWSLAETYTCVVHDTAKECMERVHCGLAAYQLWAVHCRCV